jgi:hypothetical protein
MVINIATREKLLKILPKNYRMLVAERVGCHPNTVSNVLLNGHKNLAVYTALLELAKETKDADDKLKAKADKILQQL